MYSKMVDDVLQLTKIEHGHTLECKRESHFLMHIQNVFHPNMYFAKASRNINQRRSGLIRNALQIETTL